MSDIVSANLNDMVEQYEDPEMMLKQAVREMETSIEEAKRGVVKAMASEKMVAKELVENQRNADVWQHRAETAAQAGDDAQARKALVRKQEYEKVAAALSDQHHATLEASQALRRQLEAMQVKLAEAKRRLGTLAARKKAADVRARATMGATPAQANNDAFLKFDRLREKVEMAEAEADALRELAGGPTDEPEIAAESDPTEMELDAELLELKRKMHKA